MTLNDIPPQLILPPTRFEIIRNGSVGIVSRISNDLAAKILFTGDIFKDREHFILRKDNDAEKSLMYKSDINFELYKKGISVPKPVGVERIAVFDDTYSASVMQYLPFPTGSDLGFNEEGIAKKLAQEEVGKAVDYGFIPG